MLNLQQEVLEKMNILCNYKEQIIYQTHKHKDNFEIITIIVAMSYNRYRIYKGIRYNNDISVESFTIEKDMVKAMEERGAEV
ncbi:hypothetical protein [Clostridium ljungdahlii]|uniref:Uncharacterized protein n=1 Tax=Clostridium ljungdahlii TaxID=1538 RepID=A0A162L5J8_9CLOT|nr:hypothetical protein [Clostridium ljungdahlii]OAA84708.1 hypothetical protein WY13_02607 [Clostridium ljungdahlii]